MPEKLQRTSMMVSVILCVHNGEPWLREQLESLTQQTYPGNWELVVVNDHSTDGSASTALSYAQQLPVRVIDVPDGTGLANARNVGCRSAIGDYFMFCDADDVAHQNWLAEMVAAANRQPLIGGHLDEALLNSELIRSWRYPMTESALPSVFEKWTFPVGASFGIKSSVLQEIGGFDASLLTGEEVDVAIKAQLRGYDVAFVPNAVMHYRHRPGLRPLSKQAYRYGLGNAALFRRYNAHGLRPSKPLEIVSFGLRVLRGIPGAVLSEQKRGAWIRMVSYLAGQVRGSGRTTQIKIG